MTWRGRVSLGDDLRRLHESARASDMSREIGYSSVTEGEGSLDLLTESGAVRAQIGDQPDGRFGVSIWHRGQLRFIPDLIQELQDEDDSLSGRISGLGDRMVTAEGRLDAHNTRIHNNDGRISGLGDRMVSAEGTLSSHNTRIGNAQSRADSAYSRAGDALSYGSTVNDKVNSVNLRVDTVNDKVNTAQSNAATAQARADSAWTRAGTGIANAATAQARADSAHDRIDGLNYASPGDVSTLSNRIQSLRSEVHHWMNQARASNPDLPPPIPN